MSETFRQVAAGGLKVALVCTMFVGAVYMAHEDAKTREMLRRCNEQVKILTGKATEFIQAHPQLQEYMLL